MTPLHSAIIHGHQNAVNLLLAAGADTEALAPDDYGDPLDTPLTLAARLGRREIARDLWDRGVDLGLRNAAGLTALESAAMHGQSAMVSDLCAWNDKWSREVRESALGRAAARWSADTVQALLDNMRFGQIALDTALIRGADKRAVLSPDEDIKLTAPPDKELMNHGRTISLLVDSGASVNARHPATGTPAIHIATQFPETIQGLKVLLQRGANVNLQDAHGQTALFIAGAKVPPHPAPRRIHHIDGIRTLLEHGASVTIPDETGRTPLHVMAYNGPLSMFQLCLEECDAPIPKTLHGETLLHAAAAGNQLEIIQSLLDAGAGINEASSSRWSAMIFAATPMAPANVEQTLRLLLSRGANVGSTSSEGWTALHRTAYLHESSNPARVAALLISAGAKVDAPAIVPDFRFRQPGEVRNWGTIAGHHLKEALSEYAHHCGERGILKNLTPLHWACESGSLGVVEVLLRYGANPTARDSTGSTPALRAAFSRHQPYSASRRQGIIKTLLKAGACFNEQNNEGLSIKAWAVGCGLGLDWNKW
ncbi:hypothetical protein AJ80_08785 [Polytolypa hystricis UAMH7299]|uniref:Uncharacterized protein n=1 Tax=Polytolypa hystricis (strain UAMH7299) TaxID=1447883 RepID=A0A2B7X2A0_POLH7|nr:hypothetical protein AJ80_08785 [Polytolypa hystricis UAMH7299]